jgi:hypothetical protein
MTVQPARQGAQASHSPVWIDSAGQDPVYFCAEDFDVFAMSQHEALEAAKKQVDAEAAQRRIAAKFGEFIADLRAWCRTRPVLLCAVDRTIDETMVVIVARGEDEDGRLHDEMAELDLKNFRENQFRLSWLLLRESEASGLSAFVRPGQARLVYLAHA